MRLSAGGSVRILALVALSFIALTRLDGTVVYVRATTVLALYAPHPSSAANGARTFVVTSGYDYFVRETPEQVLQLVETAR